MALIDKLLHYYKLDETSGTREDSHGSLDLSVVGTVGYEAGIIGNQATFGSGDNLLQSSVEVYSANGDMFISAWITPNETSRGDVIGKSGFFKIGFGITSSQWYAVANFSTTNALVQSGTGFATGTRRHVMATYTASTKVVELFIDNVSVGTSTGVGTKNTSTNILFIGAERETTGGTIYNDSISDVDEVAIGDEIPTSDERAELYGSGTPPAYPFATSVSVDATVQTATLSTPAPAITGGASVAPTVPTATFSTPAPAISGDANVASSVVTATFSIPLYDIITPDAEVRPSTVTATFTVPAYTIAIDTSFAVSVVTATFSIPALAVQIDFSHPASPLLATFTTPAPTLDTESNIIVSGTVVTATFSIPAYSVDTEQNAMVEQGVLTATFTIPEYTVTAVRTVTVDVSVVTATFTTLAPTKVGGLWTAQGRVEGVWTPQPRAI